MLSKQLATMQITRDLHYHVRKYLPRTHQGAAHSRLSCGNPDGVSGHEPAQMHPYMAALQELCTQNGNKI